MMKGCVNSKLLLNYISKKFILSSRMQNTSLLILKSDENREVKTKKGKPLSTDMYIKCYLVKSQKMISYLQIHTYIHIYIGRTLL